MLKFWNPCDIRIPIRCHRDGPFLSSVSGRHCSPQKQRLISNARASSASHSSPKEVHLGNGRRYLPGIVKLRRIKKIKKAAEKRPLSFPLCQDWLIGSLQGPSALWVRPRKIPSFVLATVMGEMLPLPSRHSGTNIWVDDRRFHHQKVLATEKKIF